VLTGALLDVGLDTSSAVSGTMRSIWRRRPMSPPRRWPRHTPRRCAGCRTLRLLY